MPKMRKYGRSPPLVILLLYEDGKESGLGGYPSAVKAQSVCETQEVQVGTGLS